MNRSIRTNDAHKWSGVLLSSRQFCLCCPWGTGEKAAPKSSVASYVGWCKIRAFTEDSDEYYDRPS